MKAIKEMLKKNRDVGLLDEPEFNKARRCHDWRNYIPDELRSAWKDLSFEARVAAYLVAKPHADCENWD
jgi:hypothetical protein